MNSATSRFMVNLRNGQFTELDAWRKTEQKLMLHQLIMELAWTRAEK